MLRIWLITGLIFFTTVTSASDDKFLVDRENLFYDSAKITSIEEEGIIRETVVIYGTEMVA